MANRPNAAGLICDGPLNPNWKGGDIDKICTICSKPYTVRRTQAKSRFCSLKCVGISQRGKPTGQRVFPFKRRPPSGVEKKCINCGKLFVAVRAQADIRQCCSKACRNQQHGRRVGGSKNPNWKGGLRCKPYPWFFPHVSRAILKRDGHACQNPTCKKIDNILTAHHIDYNKVNCDQRNLITLCRSCNSRANFGREQWTEFYTRIVAKRLPRVPANQLPLELVIMAPTKSGRKSRARDRITTDESRWS